MVGPSEGDRLSAEGVHEGILLRFQKELDLVEILASRMMRVLGSFVERDELLATGRAGLFEAARRFDPTRGVPFRAYANVRVHGAMMDSVRQSARLPRRAYERLKAMEAATNLSASYSQPTAAPQVSGELARAEIQYSDRVADLAGSMFVALSGSASGGVEDAALQHGTDPESEVEHAELVANVRGALARLSGDEALIIKLCYFEGKSLREVAEQMGVGKSWAFRLHGRAIARLSKYVRGME
ncbi:MAG: sigma-70 family RNA polymerase sigma factor [Polyangiaceae bacterium]